MNNGYTTAELKEIIAKDLKIHVAFPFFSPEKNKGTAACCVVDTDWIEAIKNGNTSENNMLSIKTPVYVRHIPTDSNQQKQLPTTNIYVNVFPRVPINNKKLSLYHQVGPLGNNSGTSRYQKQWPITNYIHALLERKEIDGKLNNLIDTFSCFESIFTNDNLSEADMYNIFIKKVKSMLWPHSILYCVAPDNDQANHLVLEKIDTEQNTQADASLTDSSNSNLSEVFAIVQSETAYYFLANYHGTTLQDLITYNPGVLNSNMKKGFVIYQLLRTMASLHSRGIIHGNLKASNIFVDEHLWIQLAGLHFGSDKNELELSEIYGGEQRFPLYTDVKEDPLVIQWVRGDISNYSYLMILNHLAGRREGDPNFHPILPWVSDFSGSCIENSWRDFSKTKFRINKGDEQLDFTFDGPIPHHITDILSDITYYVYLARRTPVPVLCQFVRSKYEPNEYPSTMQRLYQWTPDECIPEFYTDPSIFKSIHADMPDLQIPSWSTSPEDFILQHAKALESNYVSSNLHHWIDLTFGSYLTGKEAVEAKNVALPLLAGQNSFMKHGIIQLFKESHPQRGCNWKKSQIKYENEMIKKKNQPAEEMPSVTLEPSTNEQTSNSPSSQKNIKHLITPTLQQHSITVSPSLPIINNKYNVSESSSNYTINTCDRASSVHSTTSSIDTSLSIASKSLSFENVTGLSSGNSMASALRNESIKLPAEMPEDYFTENLLHYEDTMKFSAYNKLLDSVNEIPINPILPDSLQRYNINPNDDDSLSTNLYSIETAQDMLSVGQVMEKILMAENQTVMDIDDDSSGAPSSNYMELDNLNSSYDIPCNKRSNVSPDVISVISKLKSDDWYERPTAKSILLASFPSMTIRNPQYSFPLSDHVPDMYEYLAAFYQAEWSRRLYLADKWIDKICDLEDEVFLLILPTFTKLFTHPETRIGSINLFSKLAHRLGREKTRIHLLKPIISMFETLRPSIPKVLFETKVVNEFIKRFGIPVFLQQMLPCYLEALALNFTIGSNHSSPTELSQIDKTKIIGTDMESCSPPPTTPTSVPDLASGAMVQICNQLGPILTSKHIIRQLIKILFRDDSIKHTVLSTVVTITGTLFGETFSAVQYTYLISLIEFPKNGKLMTERNARIICVILELLGRSLPYMSNDALTTELNSGFMSIIYKLLEPPSSSSNNNTSSSNQNGKIQTSILLQLTISMKTIDYILKLTAKIPLSAWETTVIPTLRKYFSGFTSITSADDSSIVDEIPSLDPRRIYQMIYAYSKLCEIVTKNTMHRLIPTSAAIESMMYDDFSLENITPSATQSTNSSIDGLTPNIDTNIPKPSTSTSDSQPVNSESRIKSWLKLPRKENQTKAQDTQAKPTDTNRLDDHAQLLDSPKLFEYATKDLYNFIPLLDTSTLQYITKDNNKESSTLKSIPSLKDQKKKSQQFSSLTNQQKQPEKESSSKNKIPTSVLPWKTKWKPSPDDKKNWNRFLSTNSEEMSKSMQFSFNDLKLRGFAGHTSAVKCFALNEVDKLFASGSRDRTIKLWSLNVHQGIENWETDPYSESLITYNGHRRGLINDIHFLSSHNGQTDMMASSDGQVHLWHPETGKLIYQYNSGRSTIVSLKPFSNSRNLVGATVEGYLTFMDTHNYCVLHTWKTSASLTIGTVKTIAVNKSETLIAVGYATGTISLLETRTGGLVASWKGGDTEISMLKFYANDSLVSCAPADHLICCWNVNPLALIKTIPATLDVISLDTYKDEIITINGNNAVSFMPFNDEVSLSSY
ncbi:unnamed protein product [Cunninghamella blakesleeana]